MQRSIFVITILAALCLATAAVAGMTMQLGDQPDGSTAMIYRFQKPDFAGGISPETLTGYHSFEFHLPVSENGTFVLQLPLARTGFDDPLYVQDDKTTWGNIGIGINKRGLGRNGRASFSADVYLPTAQTDNPEASLMGIVGDPQHIFRFLPDALTIHVDVAHELMALPGEDGPYVHTEFGPDILVPTGDNEGDPELMLRYGAGFGVRQNHFTAGVEFAGSWLLTADGADFGEASQHFLSFGAEYDGGLLSPALFYTIPTDDDMRDLLDGVLGIRVKVRG